MNTMEFLAPLFLNIKIEFLAPRFKRCQRERELQRACVGQGYKTENTDSIAKNTSKNEGRKGTETQTFWSGYFPVGWGVFHVNGWGPKSSVIVPRNTGKPNFWAGYPGFCRDIPGVPKKFEKKVCVQFSSPKKLFLQGLWAIFGHVFDILL